MKSALTLTAGALLGLAAVVQAQTFGPEGMAAGVDPNTLINHDVKCDVPFPEEAMRGLPGGFKAETVALLTFNVEGRFRFARVLRSSGNEKLDHAALRAGLEAQCEPFGDPKDPALEGSLSGIRFVITFDNSG
ncbi:MAG: energy transducer TonB, partial [Pigmentiphaga sp.]